MTPPSPTPPRLPTDRQPTGCDTPLRRSEMSNEMRTGWLAAAGQIVGTLDDWSTVYDWDGRLFESREAAVSAGFQRFGSDDFNVGRLDGDRLVWWGWMDEEHPAEDRAEVATALGLAGAR